MSSLSRLPEDVSNVMTLFRTNTRFAQGARWVLPFIYPLNSDFEFDYRDVPPALLILRALQKGGLCDPAEVRSDSLAVVICEYPSDYPEEFLTDMVKKAQHTDSIALGIQ